MTIKYFLLLLIHIICTAVGTLGQRSSYSLQAAVDELNHRETAKYPLNSPPLQQHYFTGAMGSSSDQDYWDDDFPANDIRNRHRVNKALAKYLEHENYNTDHGGLSLGPFGGYEFDEGSNNMLPDYPDNRKRSSFFRERDAKFDNIPASIFRERDPKSPNSDSELTEEFLRGIEEAQEHEQEERYKEALHHLWEKYQQQENELEGDLFEEKKRMRVPPYYMLMQKKRSYPVLPWLPYSEKKKRFPVAKRSTKRTTSEHHDFGKTDERVTQELKEIFGSPTDEKRKRSTDDHGTQLATPTPDTSSAVQRNIRAEAPAKKTNSTIELEKSAPKMNTEAESMTHGHAGLHSHSHSQHKHRKRSETDSHYSQEEEEVDSDSEEHGEQDEDDEEFDEEDEEEQKKKRDINQQSTKEIFKVNDIRSPDLPNLRRKKSIKWAKYFGIDRKKKVSKIVNHDVADDDGEKKKRDIDPEKLESMDRKLQSIEDFIIDETIKYTGAHEGIVNSDEIKRLKDHVLSRLATAYSLEKMRRSLEKLRQSVDNENHLLRNVVESESHSYDDSRPLEYQKRLSVKKEKASLNDKSYFSTASGKSKEINSNAMMSTASIRNDIHSNADGNNGEDMKKKDKRNGYLRYPELPNGDLEEELSPGHYETLNDAYLGNKNYIIGSNQCPLIETIAERCRGVDILSGDIIQELLPICGIHQICYLCGTSQVACDYQYLNAVDAICSNNEDCQSAARSVLMALLRGAPPLQLGPRECLKNPCLYNAMREIGL